MHFKFKYLEKIVGGFFILTCLIVITLIVIVARGQKWFQKYTPYNCSLEHSGGLSIGSPVMIKRLEAGRVASLSLGEDNLVHVKIDLFSNYADRIREGSMVKLVEPMIGTGRLDIIPGSKDAPLIPKKGTIPSKDVSEGTLDELIASATKLIKELEKPDGDLMQTLDNLNKSTKSLSEALNDKNSTLGMLMLSRDLYDNLDSSIRHLDSILSSLDESAPDMSDAVVEARRGLEETNKVLGALQKSIFLRGNIEEYMEEDSTLRVEGRAE